MAKLNGVHTVNMVDGDITKISYLGDTYEMVEGGRGDVKLGDVVLNNDYAEDAPAGEYFEVVSGGFSGFTVIDNAGDIHGNILHQCTIFRKVGPPESHATIGGDPQVGDKIRITRAVMAGSDYEIGDVLIVQYLYPDNDVRVEENRRLILRSEFEIIGRNSDSPSTDERIDSLETRVTELEEGAEDSGVDEVTGGISESKYSPRDVVRGDSGNLYVLYCRCPENDYAGEGIAWRANESYFGWIGEDQIEKVSDEITSATPKIGDKVIVVKEIASRGKYAIGDVLTVEEVVGDSGIHVKDIGVGLLSSEFKVVEIAPDAPTFEVGDYAKFTRDEHEHSEGDVVLITDDDGADSLPLRIEKVNGESYGYANRDSLVPATDAEVAEAKQEFSPKFSVGDFAKVCGDTYNDDIDEGTIVKIVAGIDDDGDYEIQLLDKSDFDHAPASSLEKLSEKEAKFAEIGRKVDEYNVGDIVEVIDEYYGLGEVGVMFEAESLRAGKFPENRNGMAAYVGPAGDTVKLITPVEHLFDK